MTLKQDSKRALFYAMGYGAFCTLMLYSMYPSDPFAFEGTRDNLFYFILTLLALPGQLLSFGIRFGGIDSRLLEIVFVTISQLINVLIWWRIVLYFMRK